MRLVGDDLDLRAPGVQGQTLLVGLRDRVRVRYQRPGVAGEATRDIGVGRPGNEDGPLAARRARWHIIVLRQRGDRVGPVVGNDDAGAMRIARRQVEISNEIYVQCAMTWGDPARADVSIVEPPHDALLSVSDNDGFSAAGGVIRVQVNGTAVGPVRQVPGWHPVETARALAAAIRARGLLRARHREPAHRLRRVGQRGPRRARPPGEARELRTRRGRGRCRPTRGSR